CNRGARRRAIELRSQRRTLLALCGAGAVKSSVLLCAGTRPPRGGGASYFASTISTRRFFWRPSGSSEPSGFLLGATGLRAPKPCVVIRTAPSHSLTDLARRSESFWL